MSRRFHTGAYGRSLWLPTPVSTRMVRALAAQQPGLHRELHDRCLGIQEVRGQPVRVGLPRLLGLSGKNVSGVMSTEP